MLEQRYHWTLKRLIVQLVTLHVHYSPPVSSCALTLGSPFPVVGKAVQQVSLPIFSVEMHGQSLFD